MVTALVRTEKPAKREARRAGEPMTGGRDKRESRGAWEPGMRGAEPLTDRDFGRNNGHGGIGKREMMERNAYNQMLRDQGYNGPIEGEMTFTVGGNGHGARLRMDGRAILDGPALMAREVERREKATHTGHHD